jgi:integrase
MVEAMLFGGLRRCEVLGLRLADVNIGERRLFITEGKGGRQWIVPISSRFFATLGAYVDEERPRTSATGRLFVVLKRPRRGWPLSADGLDEILEGDCAGAGLPHLSCHQLRHACFTRLREAGTSLEAIQAQAGHASIDVVGDDRIGEHGDSRYDGTGTEMRRQVAIVLYVVAMAAVIVGVDLVFFRNRVWERLTVNIGIVLVFAAFYWRFLRRP